ncbi:hypothetical protein NE237_022570 [Protea cynaroides]|uniref:Probable purine permease n=1 Tax=Protea cynaroides TaxID=273540 RepID=A0A9Q0H9X7_9MAGN|nr:hypothetical protein NE237_022570 [Protea cynaroides]
MEMEPMEIGHDQVVKKEDAKMSKYLKITLLLLNCAMLAIGTSGGPIVTKLYFLHGGKRIWFSSWLETAGWPIIILPLVALYLHRRHRSKGGGDSRETTRLFFITPFIFIASAVFGILTGLDDYLYAYGLDFLPASTSALVNATQLGFTALFAFFLVRQKFTAYSINSIFLLTLAAVVLAFHTNGDRAANETSRQYFMGFLMTIAASALYGLVLPMVELTYKKANQAITYTLVLEMQLVISIFGTLFCTIGMLVNKDFEAIPREARAYTLGEAKYYWVVAFNAIAWQCFFLGAIGVIFCGSSLLSAIIITSLLPITEILTVIFFNESFKVEKGMSLILSLWGFASYFYGELKASKKRNQHPEPENPHHHPPTSYV